MARRDSAARRFAEAAFEVATRDGTIERWRSELETASAVVGDERSLRALANPAIPLDQRSVAVSSLLQGIASDPVQNLVQLLLKRGRIEQLPRVAAEFRRLDDRRLGVTHATVTSAAAVRFAAATCAVRSSLSTNVVASGVPFHNTCVPLIRLLPSTVSVKEAPSMGAVVGSMVVINGWMPSAADDQVLGSPHIAA